MGFFDDYKGILLDVNQDFVGVTANGKAFARIATGQTLMVSQLVCLISGVAATDAQIAAQITNIRLLMDGVVKYELSGADALMLANFYRPWRTANDGTLPLFFARPWLERQDNQDAPAWGLKATDSCSIEVTTTAATINSIQLYHELAEAEELGDHIVTGRVNYNYAASGLQTINDLPTDPNWSLHALHIVSSTVINQIELVADRVRILLGTPATLNARYRHRNAYRAVQTGYQTIDFCARNRVIDALPLSMQTLQLKITWNAAPNSFGLISEIAQTAPLKGAAPRAA